MMSPENAEAKPRRDALRVAVLIATRGRRHLLEERALASVAKQTRLPEYLVVIEDTIDPHRPSTRRVLHRSAFPKTRFIATRNARSPGVSGAWNTGLARLAEIDPDPSTLFVAILDDDDRYEPDHLESCLDRAREEALDLVAAGMWRHERTGEPPIEQHPPEKMEAAEFLVRSQHLQGSNLFVRLSTLLEAGNFDEGQTSTTDRDVCTRLADLPKLAYARLGRATVHHHAEPERDRMSTPRSITRCRGLTEFHRKWRSRMSVAQERSSRLRGRELFAWIDPPPPFDLRLESPATASIARVTPGGRLFVASVVSQDGLDSAREFSSAIARDRSTLVESIWVVDTKAFRDAAIANARPHVPKLRVVDAEALRDALGVDANSLRGAPHALLSALVGAVARERDDAVWLVRDDFSPKSRLATKAGEIDVPIDVDAALAAARRTDSPIQAGQITGDPVEIPEFALRVELVDALHNLYWLGKSESIAPVPDRGAENSDLRRGRQAWAFDASNLESDRIERPTWLTPSRPDETVKEAFSRLARALPGILEGRRVFRHNVLDAGSFAGRRRVSASLNLLLTDTALLREAPLVGPWPDSAMEPRDHSIFSSLAGVKDRVGSSPGFSVARVSRPLPTAPNPERCADAVVADAIAAAFSIAAEAAPRCIEALESDSSFTRVFERAFDRQLRERTRRVVIGMYRVRGLARSLLRRAKPQSSPWAWWWEPGNDRESIHAVRDLVRTVRDRFDADSIPAFRAEVTEAASRVDASTASRILAAARDHRAAMRSVDTLTRLVRVSEST